MNFISKALIASTLACAPMALHAQEITEGTTIYGADNAPVGTVSQIVDGTVIIDTGEHKAPVAQESIYAGQSGPSVAVTKAQIDTMMAEQAAAAAAARDAALVEGAPVLSVNGNPAGKLRSVNLTENVVVLESSTGQLPLKKEHFAVTNSGALVTLFTRQQLINAAKGASQ